MSGVLYLIPNTLGDGDAAALAQSCPSRFARKPRRSPITSAKTRKRHARS